VFLLDQADPNTLDGLNHPSGAVYSIKLSDGSVASKIAVGSPTTGIAASTDPSGKTVVDITEGSVVAICDPFNPTTPQFCGAFADSTNDFFMGVDALNSPQKTQRDKIRDSPDLQALTRCSIIRNASPKAGQFPDSFRHPLRELARQSQAQPPAKS
jgi:hypothetical protein